MKDLILGILLLVFLSWISSFFHSDDSDNADNGARYEDAHMRGARGH